MDAESSSRFSQIKQFDGRELVFMLGEELKKPLTNIKLISEGQAGSEIISLEARKALRTIDNVLLYQSLASDQLALKLEPIHVGSTITSVANSLQPLSMQFGCETEIFIQSGINTVDTDKKVLKSGLESLWQALLGMTEKPSTLTWNVQKSSKGIRVMLINNSVDLSKVSFSKIDKLAGTSRQPLSGIAGPATDLMTAYGLFNSLGAKLTKVRLQGKQGLAVTLKPSQQLLLF